MNGQLKNAAQVDSHPRIWLSPPHLGEQEKVYVEDAFRSNWIAPLGPHVDAFEREIAQYTGSHGALALASGTAALHLALRLAGVEHGDYVICSSLTFVASANPILYLGAHPVFVDVEPETWNMCPLAFERACRAVTDSGHTLKAAVVVNLYGQSADLQPIAETCDRYGIVLIEDAAESLGATYRGKASGTWGKYGVFSFNGNKIITTSGGGMLVSDDLAALATARHWATQARDPAPHYQHSAMGYNYRLSNVLAAIGRGQLEQLDARINRRRDLFRRYQQRLEGIEGFRFMPESPSGRSTRWLTAFTVDEELAGVSAGQLIDCLARRNIEARPVWKPLHLQPLFARSAYFPYFEGYSVCDRLFAEGICLPSGSSLTNEEQDLVIVTVETCLQNRNSLL
ncbi:DegT/DnrJ/EryC1/StrS family aminotransferase [Paenibacillus koleovorans]|uniref:DegT/DnrJ/EryC1/StrS family aminotransferase n=1 Tax=Paenibacillus koleovorans TaxID=121608 RepID=UPI000FDAF17A|nr:aminotransferase class I/II-fold pyridoxal phosphate-dependent enzyme [Paenibacillus koleovorans]